MCNKQLRIKSSAVYKIASEIIKLIKAIFNFFPTKFAHQYLRYTCSKIFR